MIDRLWLYPPLAYGRLGPSPTPCDNYVWGPNDLSSRGTGRTTVQPAETLDVAEDGTVTLRQPATVTFKDAAGFRPVCPFFELHGAWTADGVAHEGPITGEVLAAAGIALGEVRWEVEVANLKPHHYTQVDDDRIVATVSIAGDDTGRRALDGRSPAGSTAPLVPAGSRVPLGSVQLTRPNAELPELRLRFTPAVGAVYGPTDLPNRTSDYVLPPDRLVLSPQSPWVGFALGGDDPRTNPGGLFAGAEGNAGLGLVDDVCDGTVRVVLPAGPGRPAELSAVARIVVGPPDFAPDQRPFTSAADGLTDRVRRADVRDPAYAADAARTTLEVRDLFERILETVATVNVDAQNDRARFENSAIARSRGEPDEAARDRAFPASEPLTDHPFPLTEAARARHRRFLALEVLEDVLRERPDLLPTVVREPATSERYYDRRMPALMRGSDRHPMHITRRQYDLLRAWSAALRRDIEPGT
ncbi:hypothetical protein [Parafrankia sp. EUN1f]|uniref:hypothetical protein n=1 Tax=Parafrankia sp. EUN1f TaxID=102897 RepID=UPI0001C45754|nr:hypothetical protein [Parafrankia sp. EUN1f]EFC82016.1 conserved hypothetical protein [Parafrankia sp. EUN1f]